MLVHIKFVEQGNSTVVKQVLGSEWFGSSPIMNKATKLWSDRGTSGRVDLIDTMFNKWYYESIND